MLAPRLNRIFNFLGCHTRNSLTYNYARSHLTASSYPVCVILQRNASTKTSHESSKGISDSTTSSSSSKSISESRSQLPQLSTGEKVKQAGKDTFYGLVVVGGLIITGVIGYAVFRELFSSKSAGGVYSDALKICRKNARVQAVLGEPIKAYGELGSMRGRRRHVKSADFVDPTGLRIVQVQFYLSGPFDTATVFVEKDVTNGVFRKLVFQSDDGAHHFNLLDSK